MGYQIVTIELLNGMKLTNRRVLDSKYLLLNNAGEIDQSDIKDINIKK